MADLTLREVSDRIQINDLLVRYAAAIDGKDWKLLDTCFLPDAHVDYTATGGIKGAYPEVRKWLEMALAPFPITVHYNTNSAVTLTGDTAAVRTYVWNPMGFKNPDGSMHWFTVGAYYVDKLVRTPEGWRIQQRVEEHGFMQGELPKALTIPT
jgi:3-phenylpropionate/cinnamic acid dioxygenase small subunit